MVNEGITSIFDTINNRAEKLFVQDRVSRALTDPNPMFRGWAITSLKNAYPTLVRGFVADNQFFLSLEEQDGLTPFYIGDVPKTNKGNYIQTYNFNAELKTQSVKPITFSRENTNYTFHGSHKIQK